jgi:heterodisulfide reductase subunit B
MKEKELQELIDSGIGTHGSLKIHAFWMHKILNSIIGFVKDSINSIIALIEKVETKIEKLNQTLKDPKLVTKTIDEINVQYCSAFDCNLRPNKYTKIVVDSFLDTLRIHFGDPIQGVVNEYLLEITTNTIPIYLEIDGSIKWLNGIAPELEPNSTYQMSIIDNLGIIGKFTNN